MAGGVHHARLRAVYAQDAVHTCCGGTIPFMALLGARFLKTQFFITGVLRTALHRMAPMSFCTLTTRRSSPRAYRWCSQITPGRCPRAVNTAQPVRGAGLPARSSAQAGLAKCSAAEVIIAGAHRATPLAGENVTAVR